MTLSSQQIQERLLDLAWSLWTGLGVPGQIDNHTDHAIDPEALIIFTAVLGDMDPRLRDEATDWCIRYGNLVSGARLKNLLANEPQMVHQRYGEFAATVAMHSSLRWPGRTSPREHTPKARSKIHAFDRKSHVVLRLRGLLGVGARAEVVRSFLASPSGKFTATDLATETNYTKRNVAQVLEALRLVGFVKAFPIRNHVCYTITNKRNTQLREQLAPMPTVFLRWSYILRLITSLFEAMKRLEQKSDVVRSVEIRAAIDELNDVFHWTDLTQPKSEMRGPNFWLEFVSWLKSTVDKLAAGI